MGQKGTQAGQQIDTATSKSSQSMNRLSQSTQQTTASMSQQVVTVAALGTAAATTFTSLSNLDKAQQRLEKSAVGVARAQDLLATTELSIQRIEQQLVQLREKGQEGTERYRLAQEKLTIQTQKLTTAQEDLAIKQREVEIQTGALADTQINMAFSIGNTVLFSIISLNTMLKAETKAMIGAKLATIAHAFSLKGLRTAMTLVASHPLMLVVFAAVTAATILWTTNLFGVRDALISVWEWLKNLFPMLQVLETLVTSILPEANAQSAELNDNMIALTDNTIDVNAATVDYNKSLINSTEGMGGFTTSIIESNSALENHKKLMTEAIKQQDTLGFKLKKNQNSNDLEIDPNTGELKTVRRKKAFVDSSTIQALEAMGLDGIAGNFRSFGGPKRVLTRGLARKLQNEARKRAERRDRIDKFNNNAKAGRIINLLSNSFGINTGIVNNRNSLFRAQTQATNQFSQRFGALGFSIQDVFSGNQQTVNRLLSTETKAKNLAKESGFSFGEVAREYTTDGGFQDINNYMSYKERRKMMSTASL